MSRPGRLPRPQIVHQPGTGWSFQSTNGVPFFSLGVCCVNQGTAFRDYDPENPSYGSWRYYPTLEEWETKTLSRLKSWGFTTLGGWADPGISRSHEGKAFYQTPVLHIGTAVGAPWWDMWDPVNVKRMENTARDQIREYSDSSSVMGYYSDNELGWWNAALWKTTLEQPASSGQRRALVGLLKRTYGGDWTRLSADFDSENCTGWKEFERKGMLYIRAGGNGIRVMRAFLGLLADRYYGLMRQIIRKNDPEALYLGDRYPSFFYPEVAAAAGAHVDAISSNLNAHFSDGTFVRCYLDSLHRISGRPVLVTEFYMSAMENRSGNRNSYGVFPTSTTQEERAVSARRTLQELIRLPYLIGADWFQYYDEPTHGREDGENYNFGLVDIEDRPYEKLVPVFQEFGNYSTVTRARMGQGNPAEGEDAPGVVPKAPENPFAEFKPPEALRFWDRKKGWVKPLNTGGLADLYVGWKPGAVYLGLYSLDIVEAAYYRGAGVPKINRALWEVRVHGGSTIRARIGAGREALCNEPAVKVENSSGMNQNVSNVAAMEIPVALFSGQQFKAGDRIQLEVRLVTHAGAAVVEWTVDRELSE